MTIDLRHAADVERFEDDLARLIRACIARGALTASETAELRHVTGELLALDRGVEEWMAAILGAASGRLRRAGNPTLH